MKKLTFSDRLSLVSVILCEVAAAAGIIVLALRLFEVFPEPRQVELTLLFLVLVPAFGLVCWHIFWPYYGFRQMRETLPEDVRPVIWNKILLSLRLKYTLLGAVMSAMYIILGIPLWIILPAAVEAVLLLLVRPSK